MKKLVSNIWLITALVLGFVACTSEVDDVYDKPVSERASDVIKNDMAILTSAQNGWVMYMYGDLVYGGYNVLCKFNDDHTVTVASEIAASDAMVTSHFKLIQSAGVVLSFDEYNEIFNWFSDPVNPAGLGTNGEGFKGDLEFRVISATNERIELRGKKTTDKIVMIPMPANIAWKDYLDKVAEVEEGMACANVYTAVGDAQIETSTNYRRLSFSVEEDGANVVKRAPYVVTPEGYQFYQPVEINGKTVSGFKYAEGAITYESKDDPTVKLVCVVPPLTEQLLNGYWFISDKTTDSEKTQLFRAFSAELKANTSLGSRALTYAYVGTFTNKGVTQPGLIFSSRYTAHYMVDFKVESDDMITFEKIDDSYGLLNSTAFLSRLPTIYPVIGMFTELTYKNKTYGKARTYKLETDNIKNPSYIKMTDVSDPTYSFNLFATQVNYPFGS